MARAARRLTGDALSQELTRSGWRPGVPQSERVRRLREADADLNRAAEALQSLLDAELSPPKISS